MKARDANSKLAVVFALCAMAIVAVTWTLREKFLSGQPMIALAVNAAVAIVIALLFARYLENKLNASVDFLVTKIRRVGSGDLTQVFKEDPEDMLPYGLSSELGEMMKYFRENVGQLWRASSMLVKQLNQFLGLSREVLDDFRTEVESLSAIRGDLESVRRDTVELMKNLSALKVNAGSDTVLVAAATELARKCSEEIRKGRSLLKATEGSMARIGETVDRVDSVLESVSEVSRRMSLIGKSITDITTESSLVKLNASIDATQESGTNGNYQRLVEEVARITDSLGEISQECSGSLATAANRVGELLGKVKDGRVDLGKGIDDVRRSGQLLQAVDERAVQAGVSLTTVVERVRHLGSVVDDVDSRMSTFNELTKAAEGRFDKLYSDTHITLLKFDGLGSKIESMKGALRQLEEFNRLFEIG